MPQFFWPTPEKRPMTRPVQPPAHIPGANGKMYPPEKHLRNEKLKSLQDQTELVIDKLMENMDLNAGSIQTLLIMIEFMEAMKEPFDPV